MISLSIVYLYLYIYICLYLYNGMWQSVKPEARNYPALRLGSSFMGKIMLRDGMGLGVLRVESFSHENTKSIQIAG